MITLTIDKEEKGKPPPREQRELKKHLELKNGDDPFLLYH